MQVLKTVLPMLNQQPLQHSLEHLQIIKQLDLACCCLQPLEQRRQNVLYMLGHQLNYSALLCMHCL